MTQPFHFPNGQLAHSAEDLLRLCQEFPDDGVNYLVREDLEKWLAYIGKEDIARCAANARQTPLEDRQKLEEFLTKCHALSSPESKDIPNQPIQPEPVTLDAKIADTEAKPESTSPVTVKTSVREPEQPSTPLVSDTADISVAEANSKQSIPSASTETKPSFFKMIARLIVNVIYRNKDKS